MNMRCSRLASDRNNSMFHPSPKIRGVFNQGLDRTLCTRNSTCQIVHTTSPPEQPSSAVTAYFTDLGCSKSQLSRMEQRLPHVLRLSLDETIIPAVGFLQSDVGLGIDELPSVIARFPVLFTFGVKAHLKPHLAYLLSLGVSKTEVAGLVTTRPLVLGPGIDTVIKYLLRRGLPRRKVVRCTAVRPLDAGRRIARARQHEGTQQQPLFLDTFAELLSNTSPLVAGQVDDEVARSKDIIATKYIDESLLNAMSSTAVNTINSGDYRQVVLLGDGMDTRPYRLPWPTGTLLFLVASSESHELAEAVLAQTGNAHVQRGCLLRRVNADLQNGASFAKELFRAGFQGDKLSVWAVQGLHGQQLPTSQLHAILEDISGCAAFHSLIVGELPAASKQEANVLLAEYGLLGAAESFAVHGEQYQRGGEGRSAPAEQANVQTAGQGSGGLQSPEAISASFSGGFSNSNRLVMDVQRYGANAATETREGQALSVGLLETSNPVQSVAGASDVQDRWLFASQQMRLSLTQMGVYGDHVAAAEGADEDFYADVS